MLLHNKCWGGIVVGTGVLDCPFTGVLDCPFTGVLDCPFTGGTASPRPFCRLRDISPIRGISSTVRHGLQEI